MNEEQVKSAIRWVVATFGGVVAGWFAAKGWFTIDQVTGVLNSPVFLSLVGSLVMGAWGLFTHTKANAVAVVDALAKDPTSPVAAVITAPTPAGRDLAQALPGKTTVVAGTTDAKAIASNGVTP